MIERVHNFIDHCYAARRKAATLAVGTLGALLLAHIVFGANGILVLLHKRSESRQLGRQLQELKIENERLSQHIDALRSDPATIEREAREQLRYARPGEIIYTVPVEHRPAVAKPPQK